MAHAFSSAGGPGALLFGEDFDLPPPSRKPETVVPLYSAAELAAAREQAANESRDKALAEADQSDRAAVSRTLAQIAAQLDAAREEAASIADQSAEAIARLLLDCFAAAFPSLCARHGAGELGAILREILPALHRQPRITVKVNPRLVPAMAEEIQCLDAELAARVRLIPTDAVASGDARVAWENGAATRDMTSLWNQIENILAPAGLLSVKQTAKEDELVE
jgi:flagellar biosynthesis/type III secretory pathway protein FliH